MIEQNKQLTHPTYRPDIDGLRAVAVLSVVAFHAFPNLIASGFIGVDIFFVISGFLISSIIFSNLEHNSFSLIEFYRRRIKRIFPALLLVLISSLIVGWFILMSEEYRALSKHIVGGVTFLSNIILWRESGYFDTSSELKPLLHLWSLAVEEQFYIFWPLFLAFVWKRKWSFVAVTATIATISFAINIYATSANPSAAFYMPLPRFWELMIGSLLAYITLHKPHLSNQYQNMQSTFGFVLLLLGMIFINNERAFPGWWALLPTFGAFFVISAGPAAWFNVHVLSNKLFVWFGLISYPLYLWHWSLLSFAAIQTSETTSTLTRTGLVIASIVLAWLTYKFIEKPVRFGKHSGKKVITMIIIMICVGGTSYLVFKKNGMDGSEAFGRAHFAERDRYLDYFNNRIPEMHYFTSVNMPEKFRYECDFYNQAAFKEGRGTVLPTPKIDESCYVRNNAYSHSVFIWGDSHGQQLYSGIKNNIPHDWQILQVSSSGCIPDVNTTESSTLSYCQQSNWFAIKTIKDTKPDVVIVARNLGHTLEYFIGVENKLKAWGVNKIIFTGPTPHWTTELPKIIVRKLWRPTPRRTYIGVNHRVLEQNLYLQKNFQSSGSKVYANIINLFCDHEGCLTYLGEDKQTGLTAFDEGHLTPIASDYVAKNLLVPLITVEQTN